MTYAELASFVRKILSRTAQAPAQTANTAPVAEQTPGAIAQHPAPARMSPTPPPTNSFNSNGNGFVCPIMYPPESRLRCTKPPNHAQPAQAPQPPAQIGRASCRERVEISV